jgi:hypothetical protein
MANKNAAEHNVQDELFPLSLGEADPYRVKGSDFPNKGGSGMGPKPGHDVLCPETGNQEAPRHAEDPGPGEGGYGTPSNWQSGGRSGIVAASFPVGKNKGEGEESPSKMSIAEGVDCVTGKLTCAGYKETSVEETPEASVSIGRH